MSTLDNTIGNTPLVKLQRLTQATGSEVWLKLEGNNPAGSVKDRPVRFMVEQAERRGEITPGDRLIEATSGNTGIALAMIAAVKGHRLRLLMPENMSRERQLAMRAYGAELVLVSPESGMEGARYLARQMAESGEGKVLDQFNNPDNALAHFMTTGPEIWKQTQGALTHGTTGTLSGVSRFLKQQRSSICTIGLQPASGSHIPGIRRWAPGYEPGIFQPQYVDHVMDITQQEAETTL